MPKKANTASLRKEASFVFKGTVLKLKATTTTDIPKSDRTVVVRVDETIRAPEPLAHYNGQNITVQLAGRKKVTKGQQLVFYTNGLLYGESLAVESVDQGVPETVHAAVAAVAPDPVRNMVERDILNRAATADAVISGRVTSVRVPADVVAAHGAVLAGGLPTQRISEHDPDWRIAEVQVDQVHRGTHESKTAEIRFPSSDDVMWHYAPKLRTGQDGLFILHKAERERAAARAAPTEDSGEYVCLNSADFQPWEKLGDLGDTVAKLSAETAEDSSEG
jgi:hypothetical protein